MEKQQLHIITGKDKETFLYQKYSDLFHYHMNQILYTNSIDNLKQSIYYGVQYIKLWLKYNSDPTPENVQYVFQEICLIEECICLLTYEQFINIFPPTKEYDGKKYGSKDYWFTKEYLEQYDLKTEIYDSSTFLMDYYNHDIVSYNISKYMICDKLRRLEGQPSILETYIEEQNLPIETYTYNKTTKTMKNKKTGKKVGAKRKIPSYLKVVK